jgi:hypothetical protein
VLTVTEAASANLAQMPKQQGAPEDLAVRLVCEGRGIALRPDGERTGDTTFQHEGRTVLPLDARVSELLAEDTRDLEGAGLTRQHPKESE